MKFIYLVIILLISGFLDLVEAQTQTTQPDLLHKLQTKDPYTGGVVEIIQDPMITTALEDHLNELKNQNGIPGWRILIFSSSDQTGRDESTKARARFILLYPEIASYWSYESPDYKVYVGDFRTKSEALKVLNNIKKLAKHSGFIQELTNP